MNIGVESKLNLFEVTYETPAGTQVDFMECAREEDAIRYLIAVGNTSLEA